MRYDLGTIMEAQRRAYNLLSAPVKKEITTTGGELSSKMRKNEWHVNPKSITAPAILVQEMQFTNAKQQFIFDFSQTAPPPSVALNNVKLPKNNIAAIYGIQFLIGTGDVANIRDYNASGATVNDNSIYNSIVQLKIETDTVIDNLEGQMFLDVYQTVGMKDQSSGLVLINPIRVLSGEMGIFQILWNLKNSISTVVLTPNTFLSVRLHCVMGQASA